MGDFLFEGYLGASKSVFNRALVIQSYEPGIRLQGKSDSDDIDFLQAALAKVRSHKVFDCGQAGTVLRFLALRLSREKGVFRLKGSSRLMQRLLPELQQTLSQVGTECRIIDDTSIELNCDGWHLRGDGLWVPSKKSSQFASGVLLNSWDLAFPLHFIRSEYGASEAYFKMTVEMVRLFGMKVDTYNDEVFVPKGQRPSVQEYKIEADVSSAFTVAALAALRGRCHILNFPLKTLQPDAVFVAFLEEMGVKLTVDKEGLQVFKSPDLKGIDVEISNTPDLFPVLAVLACFASSSSRFRGLDNLGVKESDRLKNTQILCEKIGAVWNTVDHGEVQLTGTPEASGPFEFNCDQDHRMVMAAAVAQAGGCEVHLKGVEEVSKSFRSFLDIWKF